MPTSVELTDAYLAALLAKEASSTSRSVVNRPRDVPKPNIRFLRNIIRETDSHNAVLLERDRRLASRSSRERWVSHSRRYQDEEDRSAKRRRTERPDRWSAAFAEQGLRRQDDDRKRTSRREGLTSHRDHHRRSRSRSPVRTSRSRREDKPSHRGSRQRSRSRSSERKNSSRARHERSRRAFKRRSRSPRRSKNIEEQRVEQPRAGERQYDSDSDPLEAIIGPRAPPKVKPRGRGTTASSSGIDARFADAHYDPSKDVQHTAHQDDDDWDMALSALQDRAKWRTIGADRLRAAGFSDAEVAKWEDASSITPANIDKDIDNVVWRKHGEARDWDRGKITMADGEITSKAAWTAD